GVSSGGTASASLAAPPQPAPSLTRNVTAAAAATAARAGVWPPSPRDFRPAVAAVTAEWGRGRLPSRRPEPLSCSPGSPFSRRCGCGCGCGKQVYRKIPPPAPPPAPLAPSSTSELTTTDTRGWW
ncbi:hypothetical protein Vretimale_17504, partial [Volvox reticuliferus]